MSSVDPNEWDRFVDTHPEGRFSHLTRYQKVIEKTYALKGFSIGLFTDNRLRGIFPSVLVSSFLSKKKLVSMPFSDYGGMLLAADLELPADRLESVLNSLLEKSGAECIEIRGPYRFGGVAYNRSLLEYKDCSYATIELENPALMERKVRRNVRADLRKAYSGSLMARVDSSEEAIRTIFFPLYLKAMKKFGTPPHSIDFFCNMKSIMGERIILISALCNDRPVAVVLAVKSSSRLHGCYIASDVNYIHMRPNHLTIWELIKWGYNNNCNILDFGVARYEGQKRFKAAWGSVFKDYNYYFYPPNIRLPQVYLRPSAVNKLWSKYVPNTLAEKLGPFIRRRLGR